MSLEITLSSQETSPLTLAEALCGRAGKLVIGERGIRLWSPEADLRGAGEIVCDLRDAKLSDTVLEAFTQAAEGRFLSARVAFLPRNDDTLVREARRYFDYILVPDVMGKNTAVNFHRRVLGVLVEEKD